MVLMIVIWIWESLDGLITRKAGAAGLEPALSPALTAATMKPFVNLAANNSGSQAPRSPCKFCCKKLQWILVNHVCGNWQGEVKIEKWRIDHGFHLLPAAACPAAFFCRVSKIYQNCKYFCQSPWSHGHRNVSCVKYFYLRLQIFLSRLHVTASDTFELRPKTV